jgi:hypothetical protein
MKEEIVLLIGKIGVPTLALSRYILGQLIQACHYLSCSDALAGTPRTHALQLLATCIGDKHQEIVENVLRVLGVVEFSDQMRMILRAVQSGRRKDIDNAVELLETCLHSDLRLALIPLLKDIPVPDRLSASSKALGIDLPGFTSFEQIRKWIEQDADPSLRQLCAIAAQPDKGLSQTDPDLVEKTICLQKNPLFQGVRIRELMIIAGVCRSRTFETGEIVLQENQMAGHVYFFYQGALGVQSRFDRMPGAKDLISTEFVGERQWIDGQAQLYTLTADTRSVLLEIDGSDFCRVIQDIPLVIINLCRLYSRQLRAYHTVVPALPAAVL